MSMKMVVIPYEKYIKLYNKSKNDEELLDINEKDEQDIKKNETLQNQDIKLNTELIKDDHVQDNEDINKDMLQDEDILEYIPKNNKSKCKSLILHMKRNNIKWDSFGQLVLGEECLSGSHIVDLLKDMTCSYKKRCTDLNSLQLIKLLLATHCPRSILNHQSLNDKQINNAVN